MFIDLKFDWMQCFAKGIVKMSYDLFSRLKATRSRLYGTVVRQTSTQASATAVNRMTYTLSKSRRQKNCWLNLVLTRWDNLMEEFNMTCLSDGSFDIPKEWPQCLPCKVLLVRGFLWFGLFISGELHRTTREARRRHLGVERGARLWDRDPLHVRTVWELPQVFLCIWPLTLQSE